MADVTIESFRQNKEVTNGFWRTAKNNVRLRQRSLPIQRGDDRTTAPLSFNQERLWWSEQAYPNQSIQNLQHQISFTGILDIETLASSLREIIKRHNILRTAICNQDGQPIQVVLPEIILDLPILDLQQLNGTEQAAEVQKLALAQAEQSFDLATAPLCRFLLIKCAENKHILLYTASHIVFDAWSHGILMRELIALHEAILNGQPSPLMELPIQYTDFSASQHQWQQDKILSSQLAYWKQHLNATIPALDLPTDHPRPASSVYQPDCQPLTLSESLTQALKALSSREGVSLYVTLLTAFKVLLYHYTGQTDLLVNSPAAGRHHSQTRDIIGCFINTLPIRSTLSSHSTFKDYLQQVSQVTEAALAHQDVPFRQLAEMIHSTNPSIPGALFILQNVPYPVLERPELKVSSTYLHRQHGKPEPANYFDLTLSVQEQAGILTASLAYNAVLFNSDRIEQMLGHYQTLLEEIVADPNCTIATLPMLTETEQHLPSSKLPTARQRSESTTTFVAPRIELERQLSEIWSTVLGIKSIGVRDNFFNLGGNSLLAVRVVAEIEKTCGYTMPVIDFFRAQTIEHLSKLLLSPLLQQEVASLPWNPLEPVKSEQLTPKTIKAPLFILNGGFNQFLSGAIWIAQRLGKEQPCYSLHMRGIDGREEPHDRVETMAEDAIQAIRTVQPEGPYYLVGLCFGGMVAYEMAQQLRQQGQKVALLLTVESASPIPREKQQDTGIEARLKRIPTPEMFDERTRTSPVLLKVFQAAHQAMATYEAEPYPGKLIVFQASEGNEVEQHDRECYLATWKQLANEVEVHTLPGDHISLYVEENIWTLVSELRACLTQARLENE